MNFKEWFFNENTVAQELKKVPDDVLKEIKTKADSVFNTIFNFHVDDKKTKEIKDWITFNTSKDPQFPKYLDRHKDFLITKYNTVNFKDPDYDIEKLIEDSNKYHADLGKNTKVGSRGAYGITLISFPDGWKWLDLKKGYCEIEGASMGHCGNVEGQVNYDHNIFSLRDPRNVPYLTFIDTGYGQLGEMKGRFNKKPEKKFHPYIIALLKHPRITKIGGGGYEPENNFSLNDLSKEDKNNLLKEKPDLRLLPSDVMSTHDNQAFVQSLAEYETLLPDGNIIEDKIKEIEKDERNTKFVIDEFKRIRTRYPLFVAIALAKTGHTVQSPLKEETVENYLQLQKINYIQIEYDLLVLYEYQIELFNTIFNKLDSKSKSTFVKYAIIRQQKLPDNFYQLLSSNDIYYLISRQIGEDDIKLPQAVHDLIKKHDEFDAMTGEMVIPKSSHFGKFLFDILRRNNYQNLINSSYFQISKLNSKIAHETVFNYMMHVEYPSADYNPKDEDRKYIYALLRYYKIDQKPMRKIISFIKNWTSDSKLDSKAENMMKHLASYMYDARYFIYRGVGSNIAYDKSMQQVETPSTMFELWMNALRYYNTKFKNKSRTLDNILINFTHDLSQKINNPYYDEQFQNQIDIIKYENKYPKQINK